jgi:hypothetical protein
LIEKADTRFGTHLESLKAKEKAAPAEARSVKNAKNAKAEWKARKEKK